MQWFWDHGIWLLVTLAVAGLAYWALWKCVPRGVGAVVRRMKALGTEEELGRDARITSRILVWIGTIAVTVGLVQAVLPRFGVDISAVISWWRDIGIAIAGWLGSHGIRLLIIIVLAIIAHQIAKRLVPRIMGVLVARKLKGAGSKSKLKEIQGRFIPWLSWEEEEKPIDIDEDEIRQRADTLSRFLGTMAVVVIWVVAAVMILSEIGVSIVPLLTTLGIAGLAVGFGAQYFIRDVIAGFFVIMENQYAIGDVVKVADITGIVEDINLRRTVLRDLDGIVHTVPNGEIKTASNYTKDWSRVNLNISVAYGENLDHVIEVIDQIGRELAQEDYWKPLIIGRPRVLRVDKFGDSGIEIKILGETKPIYQWEVMGELRKRIKRVFDEEGIEIPWPHIKLYFGEPLKHEPRGEES